MGLFSLMKQLQNSSKQMKSLIPILILINISTSFIQAEDVKIDYTRWGLPEGVIVRIGKGSRTAPVAISPETTRLAIATTIGIWLYDSETYQEIALLAPHKPPCTSLKFSPDGRTLATGTADGKIRLWKSETGASKETLDGHTGPISKLTFTPNGETLISTGGNWEEGKRIQLWNTETWKNITTLPLKVINNAVALSPDGNVLAVNYSKEIGLWDVKTGKQIARVRYKKISFASVFLLEFSPDGELLAIGNSNDIYLWNTKTQQLRTILIGHESMVSVLKFSPDSKILASTSGGHTAQGTAIWLWNITTGERIATLLGHKEGVRLFEFSPDSNTLVSISGDLTIRLWDINTGQLKALLTEHKTDIFSLEFTPDRTTLIARDWDANIHSWDLKTGEHKNVFTGQTHQKTPKFAQQKYNRFEWYSPAIFSADGQTLYCANADNTIWMYDTNAGKLKKKLTGYTFQPYNVVISPNKQTVANAGLDNTIHLWDINTGKIKVTLKTDMEDIIPMAFSSDGKILASRGQNEIQLWEVKVDTANTASKRSTLRQLMHLISFVQERAPLRYQRQLASFARTVRNKDIRSEQYRATLKGHTGHVGAVSFSPDGKTLASGGSWNNTTQKSDTTIRLWDSQTAQPKAILTGHTSGIRCLSFSPDGKILTSGSHDNTIRLWNTSTHEKISILTGHSKVVLSVAFSPDGKILASGGYDNTIRLWDVQSGKLRRTLNGHVEAIFYLTFSPDGDILASVSRDGTILLWDLQEIGE